MTAAYRQTGCQSRLA